MKRTTLKNTLLLFALIGIYNCASKKESSYKLSKSIDSSFLKYYDKNAEDYKWPLNFGSKNLDTSQVIKKYLDYQRNNLAMLYTYSIDSTGNNTGRIIDSSFGLCQCKKINDTLQVSAMFGFFGGYDISIRIKNGQYKGEFSEHAQDTLFASSVNQKKYTTNITVGAEKEQLILSKKPVYVAGEVFLGQYEALFKPYVVKNVDITISRQKVKLIFKCTL